MGAEDQRQLRVRIERNRSDLVAEVVRYPPDSDTLESETRGGDDLTEHYGHYLKSDDLYVFESYHAIFDDSPG